MSKVVRVLASACLMLALQVLTTSFAYGQGGTTSTLSGVAVDTSGAILPGADVTVDDGIARDSRSRRSPITKARSRSRG